MDSLPSHRAFLTKLIEGLSATKHHQPAAPPPPASSKEAAAQPPAPQAQAQPQSEETRPPIPLSSRPLLLTLHVLFPNLLLPALDLLDRRLISRLRITTTTDDDDSTTGRSSHDVYIVKSLATTMSSRRSFRGGASSSPSSFRRYAVRTEAWNCSCASFAYDAFPPVSAAAATSAGREKRSDGGFDGESHVDLDFGGLSLDGLAGAGEDVPCCKHLLACLLAERWGDVLDSYVEDRAVTREEMAGIIAGTS